MVHEPWLLPWHEPECPFNYCKLGSYDHIIEYIQKSDAVVDKSDLCDCDSTRKEGSVEVITAIKPQLGRECGMQNLCQNRKI